MAFTKKTVTTAPAKAPTKTVQLAKKKAVEIEEVEVEEVESEYEGGEQDSYESEQEVAEEQEVSEAPAPRQYRAPVQQAKPVFNGGASGWKKPAAKEGYGVRLTGLFPGKREGLFTGKLRSEDIQNLAVLCQEALNGGKEIAFFLWENQPMQGKPLFNLTANISIPKAGGFGGGYRRGGQGQGGQGGQGGYRRY